MSTLKEKLIISIFSATLFILVSLPQSYKLTNTFVNNCPTSNGLLLHAFVFFVLSFLSMWRSNISTGLKVKFSIYGTLLYYLVSSPAMFSLTGSIFGQSIATNGCPTTIGTLLHSLVYCAGLVGLMYLPDEEK